MEPLSGSAPPFVTDLPTLLSFRVRQIKIPPISTAFNLPDGSTHSPDVAWVHHERWDALAEREQDRADDRRFPPICPDFGIEPFCQWFSEQRKKENEGSLDR